jgi:hypothetical protein
MWPFLKEQSLRLPAANTLWQTVILTDVMGDDTDCVLVLPVLGSGGLWQASNQGGFGFNLGKNPHEIYGRKCGTSTGFSEIASVFPCHYHSTIALYPSIRGLAIGPAEAAEMQSDPTRRK